MLLLFFLMLAVFFGAVWFLVMSVGLLRAANQLERQVKASRGGR